MFHSRLSRRSLVAGATTTAFAAQALPGFSAHAQDVTVNILRGEHPSQPILNDAPAHLAITEATGVGLNFQPVPGTDYNTRQQTVLATDQVPDLLFVGNLTQIRQYTTEGVLTPLMSLINEHGPNVQRYLASNPQFNALFAEDDLFYLPMLFFNQRRLAPMPMIRKDILDQTGRPIPVNFDELLETIVAMREVAPESVGWTNRNHTSHFLGIVAYPLGSGLGGLGNGMYFDEDVEGGRWLFGPTKPEFKDALAYLRSAYEQGALDPEFGITPADGWQTKNGSGQGIFTWDNMSFASNWNAAIRAENPDSAGWLPIPTLEGPKGARGRDYDFIREGWAIGADASDPAAIIRTFDWMLTPEGIDTTNWGIEGEHFTRNQPLPASIEDYSSAGLSQALPSTRNTLLPEVHEHYATQGDPFRMFQSDTGTGLLDFALGLDDTITYLWTDSPELDSWFETTNNDPGLRSPVPAPSFTLDEADELRDLLLELSEVTEPAFDQVILGQMSLDDYDSIISAAEGIGSARLEDIYNTAQERQG